LEPREADGSAGLVDELPLGMLEEHVTQRFLQLVEPGLWGLRLRLIRFVPFFDFQFLVINFLLSLGIWCCPAFKVLLCIALAVRRGGILGLLLLHFQLA